MSSRVFETEWKSGSRYPDEEHMNNIIYIVGLVVIVLVILGFFGLT